jgi:hypothetical protein
MNHRSLRLIAPAAVVSLSALLAGCSGAATSNPSETVGSSEAAYSESANEKTAFNFFVSKGLTKDQAAGIVGNLIQESDVDPTIEQYGGGPGRGIAQWSEGGRWNADHDDNVLWYADKEGQSPDSLMLQLNFIWYELTEKGYGLDTLRRAGSVSAATVDFQTDFEGCGECDQSNRIAYAEEVLSAYGGGGSSGGGKSGGGSSPHGCYSDTRGKEMVANACVQSRSNDEWYQCDDGDWVDRWTDPTACDGVYPL